jgi:hypothetical protein
VDHQRSRHHRSRSQRSYRAIGNRTRQREGTSIQSEVSQSRRPLQRTRIHAQRSYRTRSGNRRSIVATPLATLAQRTQQTKIHPQGIPRRNQITKSPRKKRRKQSRRTAHRSNRATTHQQATHSAKIVGKSALDYSSGGRCFSSDITGTPQSKASASEDTPIHCPKYL